MTDIDPDHYTEGMDECDHDVSDLEILTEKSRQVDGGLYEIRGICHCGVRVIATARVEHTVIEESYYD